MKLSAINTKNRELMPIAKTARTLYSTGSMTVESRRTPCKPAGRHETCQKNAIAVFWCAIFSAILWIDISQKQYYEQLLSVQKARGKKKQSQRYVCILPSLKARQRWTRTTAGTNRNHWKCFQAEGAALPGSKTMGDERIQSLQYIIIWQVRDASFKGKILPNYTNCEWETIDIPECSPEITKARVPRIESL